MVHKIKLFFIICYGCDFIFACTYCAVQDNSSTINIALIPLAILVSLPFFLFGLLILIVKIKNFDFQQ